MGTIFDFGSADTAETLITRLNASYNSYFLSHKPGRKGNSVQLNWNEQNSKSQKLSFTDSYVA